MDLAAMGNTRRRSIMWAVIYLDGSKVSRERGLKEKLCRCRTCSLNLYCILMGAWTVEECELNNSIHYYILYSLQVCCQRVRWPSRRRLGMRIPTRAHATPAPLWRSSRWISRPIIIRITDIRIMYSSYRAAICVIVLSVSTDYCDWSCLNSVCYR